MPADATATTPLIDGQFEVDLANPRPGGGGLDAFAVLDRNQAATDLMAILSRPTAPPRANALAALIGQPVDRLLTPLAHGPAPAPGGGEGWFVICRVPDPAFLKATERLCEKYKAVLINYPNPADKDELIKNNFKLS